jgi:hypothetical protein
MNMKIHVKEGSNILDIQESVVRRFWANIVNQMLTGRLSSNGILAIRLHDMTPKYFSNSSTTNARTNQQATLEEKIPSVSLIERPHILGITIFVASTIIIMIVIVKNLARK